MLGIKEAAKTYNENPEDPYVGLAETFVTVNQPKPGTKIPQVIEIRFSEDGMITAAYCQEVLEGQPHGKKWGSDAFVKGLIEQNRRAIVDELPRKEEAVRPKAQLEGPRKAKRVRLDPRGF